MESLKHFAGLDKNQSTDAEVVARVLNGEKELYELLMRRHNQKLYRVVRSYLKEGQDAEDAMQDAYLLAYEKLNQFRNDSLFSTWLIRIGINVALGKLRENKRGLSVALPINHDNYALLLSQVNFMDPENIAIRKEMKQLLEKAVDGMPEKYRIIYILREVEGMSLSEVMQCLNLSESNAKVRFHRAKGMLKEYLYKMSVDREVYEFGFKRCDDMVERVMRALPSKQP